MRSGHTWGSPGGSQVRLAKNVIKLHSISHDAHDSSRQGLRVWYVQSMQSSNNQQRPFHIYGTRDRKTAFGATDFLRANDRLAALMPTALRVGNLQRDVKVILPPMYAGCDVLSFQDAVLTLAVPSSAVAAKLKQQLPKLQAKPSSLTLPPTAVDAFEQLGETLPETPQNAALIAAIKRLAERRKK